MSWRRMVVMSVVVLASCGENIPTRSPTAPEPSIGWQRINVATVPWPGRAQDVIANGDGFLLGGFSRSGAILASSSDGVRWEDRSGGVLGNDPGVAILALAAGDTAVVALLDVSRNAGHRMAFSRSRNRNEWPIDAVPDDETLDGVIAADIVWTGVEYVAVGGDPSGGDDPKVQTVIATSPDGTEWSVARPPALDLTFARGPDAATVFQQRPAVLATSPSGTNATFMLRDDGGRWSATELRDIRDERVFAIAASDDGLLFGGCLGAVGDAAMPIVWIDVGGDGRDLASSRLPGDDGCVISLTHGETDWLATGFDGGQAAVWSSSDLTTWTAAEPAGVFVGAPGAIARSAAYFEGVWAVVGSDMRSVTNEVPETVAVWRGP